MLRNKMIECSLYELNHGIGGVDLHRQLILIYAREIVEAAQEFGEHIALVFGDENEDKTA